MSDTVIKVEGLYKKFARNLRDSMYYSAADVARSMIGKNPPSERLRRNEFWALQDVSFELKKGEVLGVIGINGSGKSTLLRILSGIYPPDMGHIEVKGRVGALIAVGAGIHPHMTGRENIYLNGIILGMTQREIEKRFNEIADFSELGPFLNAPVATYSSGMRVRLGFSIAVHVEPEIMLIDEVLAVGDMAFRKKSMEKVEEIKDKTSVIFISHNMYQIARICNRTMLLNDGKIVTVGSNDEVIKHYRDVSIGQSLGDDYQQGVVLKHVESLKNAMISIENNDLQPANKFTKGESIKLRLQIYSGEKFIHPHIGISLLNEEGLLIANTKTVVLAETQKPNIHNGHNEILVKLKNIPIIQGKYRFRVRIKQTNNTLLLEMLSTLFGILPGDNAGKTDGIIKLDTEWNIIN